MTDARWIEIIEAAQQAAHHFEAAARFLDQGGFELPGDEGYRNRMTFLYAMYCGHTAFEDAMLRILALIGEQPPAGPDWHQLLIDRVARPIPGERPAVLDASLADAARDTRAFRHLASHAYRLDIKPERARPAADAGLVLARNLETAIGTFAGAIDPD